MRLPELFSPSTEADLPARGGELREAELPVAARVEGLLPGTHEVAVLRAAHLAFSRWANCDRLWCSKAFF